MCIIIYNPKGVELDKEQIKSAYEVNDDGVGFMWPATKTVKVAKGMYTFDWVWETIENFKGFPYAIHFRYKTHGEANASNCHPFKVLKNNIYMMHNGVLDGFDTDEKKSDSHLFAAAISKQIYKGKLNPDLLFDPKVIKSLGKDIKSNKLLFMRKDGKVAIVNEDMGTWTKEVWYSNTYSLQRRKSYTSYGSSHGGYGGVWEWDNKSNSLVEKGKKGKDKEKIDDDEYLEAWSTYHATKPSSGEMVNSKAESASIERSKNDEGRYNNWLEVNGGRHCFERGSGR